MKPNYFQYVMAGLVVAGFFALLFILAFTNIPNENKDLINILIGSWTTAFATVIAFYFGSSKGSEKKDETINTMANGKDTK